MDSLHLLWSCAKRGPFPVSHSLHSSDDDSAYYRVSTKPGELQEGIGPKYKKIGPGPKARVRYSKKSLDDYLESPNM